MNNLEFAMVVTTLTMVLLFVIIERTRRADPATQARADLAEMNRKLDLIEAELDARDAAASQVAPREFAFDQKCRVGPGPRRVIREGY